MYGDRHGVLRRRPQAERCIERRKSTRSPSRGAYDVAVAADGSVFFSSIGYNCVRKVDPTFLLHEVFGDCSVYDAYENGPFAYLRGIDLDDEGSLYVAQNYQIWRATPDGDLAVVTKSSYGVQRNDPSPALDARISGRPRRLATGPNNDVFFADEYQVGKVYKDLPTLGPEIDVPDGDLVHVFASYGRHLRTRHGLTGAVLREFVYDAGGLLIEMRDPFGNTVQIERNPSTGDATAIEIGRAHV